MKFRRVGSLASVEHFLRSHPALLALDTETSGLNPRIDRLLDIVLASGNEAIIFSPLYLSALKSCNNEFIMHNAKFDLAFLYYSGLDLTRHLVWDTMLMDHLRNENEPHALDHIVQTRYKDNYKELFWTEYKDYESANDLDKIEYACKDAIYTYRLYKDLRDELHKETVPASLIMHVHKLAMALVQTEIRGVKVDLSYIAQLGESLVSKRNILDKEARASAQTEIDILELEYWQKEMNKRKMVSSRRKIPRPVFNLASTKQLQDLLYNQLDLPIQYNKQRKSTTDDAALTKLSDKHPAVEKIRDLRQVEKLIGTYVEGTLERQEQGRIYPLFKINGTVTGRISSENPNLQNLPCDGDIRGMYVPDAGHRLISSDFAMLEVVIEAHYSQDKQLLRIINEGASKHDITAEALGIERGLAKTLNFAMQYRCGIFKVSNILKIGQKEAEKVFNKYWETYAGANQVFNECKAKVDSGRPIISLFGRQRRLATKFEQEWQRDAAYREAYSALIQGTGADLTHAAFYEIADILRNRCLGQALFEIHDEILIQAKIDTCTESAEVLRSVMNGIGDKYKLSVPLNCQVGVPMQRWTK